MAAALKEQILAPGKRDALIDDAEGVLNAEVKSKSGLGGMAVKGAFKILQGIRPGFVRQVIDKLLDEFIDQVEPLYQKALAEGLPPGALLPQEKSQVASALLAVTDRKAEKAADVIRKTYFKLRPSAEKHVEAAAPALGDLLNRHAAAE